MEQMETLTGRSYSENYVILRLHIIVTIQGTYKQGETASAELMAMRLLFRNKDRYSLSYIIIVLCFD